MGYAFVQNGVITNPNIDLPGSARLLVGGQPTGAWISPNGGLANGTVAEQESTGYFKITETPKPADVPNFVWESSLAMQGGHPTVVWTQRAMTPAELANQTQQTNFDALRDATTILTKLSDLETFFTDPDVVTARDQPNNTALTAQQQNRYNKAVHTEMRKMKNMIARLAKFSVGRFNPELLNDISDTT